MRQRTRKDPDSSSEGGLTEGSDGRVRAKPGIWARASIRMGLSVRSSLFPRSACSRARAAGGDRAVQNARASAAVQRCCCSGFMKGRFAGSILGGAGQRDSGTNRCKRLFLLHYAVPPIVPSTPICPGRSRRIHSSSLFPEFATRCVGGIARGRIRGGHGQLVVERSRTQRWTQPATQGRRRQRNRGRARRSADTWSLHSFGECAFMAQVL